MKKVALSEAKDQLSRYLHDAEKEEVVIMRHGKPAGVLIGFASEDDWFDYRVETDPRFLARIATARESLRAGLGTPLEALRDQAPRPKKRLQRPAGTRTSKNRKVRRCGEGSYRYGN
jgi:prevent-host-death family protein